MATCWVMVLPPWTILPASRFLKKARDMLCMSKPPVLEEAGVLGGDEGLDHHLRDLFVFDDLPVFEEEFVDQLVVVRIDPRRDAGTVVLQGGDAGEFLEEHVIDQAAPRQGGADEEDEDRDDDDPQQGASGRRSSPARGNTLDGVMDVLSSSSSAVSSGLFRRGLFLAGELCHNNAHLVKNHQRDRHQDLADGVGRGGQDGGDDEDDQDRVTSLF